MSIFKFELPAKELRKPSNNILQIGNLVKKYCHEPDYYIIYRAGYWSRWFALVNGLLTFLVIFFYDKYGFFSELVDPIGAESHYERFIHIVDYAGFLILIIIFYHIFWFHKAIGFGKLDFFRRLDERNLEVPLDNRKLVFWAGIIGGICSVAIAIFPSITVSVFHEAGIYGYKHIPNGVSESYSNNMSFILLLSLMVTVLHGFFSSSILTSIAIISARR